jgi:heme-degrading monooxygenase HmoA
MIARSWRATATPDGACTYEEHFRDVVMPDLRATPGFRAAYLMQREDPVAEGKVQIHVLTFWESMAAVSGFTGNSPQTAVVHPAARAALVTADDTVDHYKVRQHHT